MENKLGLILHLQIYLNEFMINFKKEQIYVWHSQKNKTNLLCQQATGTNTFEDKYLVRMIIKLVRNRSFTLTTSDREQNRLCRLKNRVFQKSIGSPPFQHLYVRSALHNSQKVCSC